MLATMTKGDLDRIAQIVREVSGNRVDERNFSMLESRIRSHILRLGLASMAQYWSYFAENEASERELILSLMTTHYTFFFREYAHFEALETWITANGDRLKLRYQKSQSPVRVWSAACSRGQEVYSLAMFLETHLTEKLGLPYTILGTDIDSESVGYAKNGVYPIKEVNTIPKNYLNTCWKRGTGSIKDFAAVHPNLKSKTLFESLNLLNLKSWSQPHKFDVIFCRNVFIYFTEAHVQQIAGDLMDRLEFGGFFASGLSEPMRYASWSYPALGPSCYTKPDPKVETQSGSTKPAPRPSAPTTSTPAAIPPAEPSKLLPNIGSKYRVLCVDDSPTIQTLIKKIFSRDGQCERVDVAANGREARRKLDQGKYDLITLDIHMPEVNGIEFLEKLYVRKVDPPVLMVSSVNRTDLELATKSISLGAFDYVEKPAMNNLQKASDEILTKAKMALRSGSSQAEKVDVNYDASIAQQIVVPDASMCLRVVLAGPGSRDRLEQVVRGQSAEYRSPPLMVIWKDDATATELESSVLNWTTRKVSRLHVGGTLMRPNCVYLCSPGEAESILKTCKVKSASLQILERLAFPPGLLNGAATVQVLLDEKVSSQQRDFERESGLRVSDITPSTSFPSLSVEFFVNLRKAAA